MDKQKDELRLENDEIDFISSLFGDAASGNNRLASELQFEVSTQTPQLAQLLGAAEAVRFDVRIGHYLLHFYPRIETQQDEQSPHLVLGYPNITEQPDKARSCRVDSGNEVLRVSDSDGRLHHLSVTNISATGMALTADSTDQKPVAGTTKLRLRLRFPDAHAYVAECLVVHVHRNNSTLGFGVKFVRISRKLEEKLKAYLYFRILTVPASI